VEAVAQAVTEVVEVEVVLLSTVHFQLLPEHLMQSQ
jgi:hypothetical protein